MSTDEQGQDGQLRRQGGRDTVRVEVVSGPEGRSLYVERRRVAGPKPWGGGHVVSGWDVRVDRLRDALEAHRIYP